MRLEWHNGHVWRNSPPLRVEEFNEDFFEYKFVIKNNGAVVSWQHGSNNIFNLKKLTLTLKELGVPSQLNAQG